MKKVFLSLGITLLLLGTSLSPVYAFQVSVDVIGSAELKELSPGIEKTVLTRCVAKKVELSKYNLLSITLSQLGDTLSFDAILDQTPPKAFHKDLPEKNLISETIDEMIDAFFSSYQKAQATPTVAKPLPQEKKHEHVLSEIKIPFEAYSIAVLQDTVFVSSQNTIYMYSDTAFQPWWHAPARDKIFRIYAYRDSIIALVDHFDTFHTYKISGSTTEEHWPNPVIPHGDSLISAVLIMSPDIMKEENRWSKASGIEGTPPKIPVGADIISSVMSDVMSEYEGEELITFSETGKLKIVNKKKSLWMSGNKLGNLPFHIKDEYNVKGELDGNYRREARVRTVRYYLYPRIVITEDGTIISIRNSEGLTSILNSFSQFTASRIIAYSRFDSVPEETELSQTGIGFYADLALYKDKLVGLNLAKDKSTLRFISLE